MAKDLRIGKRNDLIFYIMLVVLPIIQFIVFYVYVNFNSILLAFQKFDVETNLVSSAGFENFKKVFSDLFTTKPFAFRFKNSLILFSFSLLIGLPFSFFFSYYIHKRAVFSEVFKVVLYLPQVVSGMVLIIIYKYFVELGIPSIIEGITGEKITGLISNTSTTFGTMLFFAIYLGFGTQVLMYVSAMSGINESVVEAGEIDGTGFFTEMVYITIPSVFPTAITFIVLCLSGVFTNEMGIFSFFAERASEDVQTIGYFLFKELKISVNDRNMLSYLSALGLIFTLVLAPIVFGVRYLLNKFGPSED